MTNSVYAFKHLTGGTDDSYLDYHDGNDLSDGDMAIGIVNDNFYSYYVDADSYMMESSPGIISPDTNAGGKRWILASDYPVYTPPAV